MYRSICFSVGLRKPLDTEIFVLRFLLRSVHVAIWLNQDGVVFALVIDFCTFGGS